MPIKQTRENSTSRNNIQKKCDDLRVKIDLPFSLQLLTADNPHPIST